MRKVLGIFLCVAVAGCSFLKPLPPASSLDERLDAIPITDLPLKGRTTIYWDHHQIPFVEAEHDEDAAFALGLVHAHLRLGLMELGRRISQGRLSEIVGKATLDVDHAIRLLDFDRAVPGIIENMQPEALAWTEAFVAGINHYQSNVETLPQEFRVLGVEPTPWTVADLLTISRLAGSDANWGVWLTLVKLREREDWPELWAQLLDVGSSLSTTFDGMELDDIKEVIGGFRHSGSNALAISPARSKTDNSLFAADPHVGYVAPSLWFIAGVKSPSYHIVGVMPSGFPYFALGRNPIAAWGGTNLYAASSSWLDVSDVDPDDISIRVETIQVGSSKLKEIEIRETEWGPIISDLPQLQDVVIPDTALRWVGHQPSDETSAMLAANRATNFQEFRAAFATYAVSGMNMIYADANGNIGQVQAAKIPKRTTAHIPDIIRKPEEMEAAWQSFADATTLPALFNPTPGFVATANNKPPEGDVPVGLFFSTDDRIMRIREMIHDHDRLGVEELKAIQQDVYMAASVELRDALVAKMNDLGISQQASENEQRLLQLITRWDGFYYAHSRGALAYETFRKAFASAYYAPIFGDASLTGVTKVVGGEFRAHIDLAQEDQAVIGAALTTALTNASQGYDFGAIWGSEHTLELTHPFSAIPLVGKRYRFGGQPIGGSVQTVMKSSQNPSADNFVPHHGATARFISDLSDIDKNYFVLISGQDGWFSSSTFLDQTSMFLSGQYMQLPLQVEKVRARSYRIQELNSAN